MNKITYKRPVPKLKRLYGAGLLFLGILSAFSGNTLGIIFLISSLFFFKYDGIEIDFETKKYRNIYGILNFKFGKWEDLPDVEYISVFKTTQTSRVWVSTASTVVTNTSIKVNLFYNTNRKLEIYESEKSDDAFKIAKEVALHLDIDILDATKKESEWL